MHRLQCHTTEDVTGRFGGSRTVDVLSGHIHRHTGGLAQFEVNVGTQVVTVETDV